MSDHQYRAIARQESGHEALRVVARYGVDRGEAVITGYFTGFLLALVAVAGREAAEDVFREVIGSIPPAQVGRPTLYVVNK
jgi:hypothetical protein